MESILTSIKKLLGIPEDYEHFDTDIIIHINSALATLPQLGVGPAQGFSIKDKTATWDSVLLGRTDIDNIKSYIYLKVRMIFDPPTSSAVIEAFKAQIAELEWRINVAVDPPDKSEEGS